MPKATVAPGVTRLRADEQRRRSRKAAAQLVRTIAVPQKPKPMPQAGLFDG